MAFPDPGLDSPLERPDVKPANHQDVVPTNERNEDQERDALEHDLATESARPLTDEEKKAADRDVPIAERVYAPASERVPVQPVAGHRDVIEHPDTHTPEREAASHMSEPSNSSEPAFAGSARPNNGPSPTAGAGAGANAPYAPSSNPNYTVTGEGVEWQDDSRRKTMFMGLGFSWLAVAAGGVGLWLFLRWRNERNERNKPINRFRSKAMWAATELRERVPTTPEEAARPAMGVTTALLSVALLLWQQSRARSESTNQALSRKAQRMGRKAGKMGRDTSGKASKRAANAVSDIDWQSRLTQLKEMWNPSRLELEKIQISKK